MKDKKMNGSFDLDDLRKRLNLIRRKKQMPFAILQKEMGISLHALEGFINSKRDTTYKVACLIEDFILREEELQK